jgi:hypothetical protein
MRLGGDGPVAPGVYNFDAIDQSQVENAGGDFDSKSAADSHFQIALLSRRKIHGAVFIKQ